MTRLDWRRAKVQKPKGAGKSPRSGKALGGYGPNHRGMPCSAEVLLTLGARSDGTLIVECYPDAAAARAAGHRWVK